MASCHVNAHVDMADWVADFAESAVSLQGDEVRDRELESLLIESAPLAFRVAYGVLRQRQDAQDVRRDGDRRHRRR